MGNSQNPPLFMGSLISFLNIGSRMGAIVFLRQYLHNMPQGGWGNGFLYKQMDQKKMLRVIAMFFFPFVLCNSGRSWLCCRFRRWGWGGRVAIGDSEETHLEHGQGKSLKKLNRISYDDEAWFGNEYDYAYIRSQDEGTKSTLFLIQNGTLCGLELIDGLDGIMY